MRASLCAMIGAAALGAFGCGSSSKSTASTTAAPATTTAASTPAQTTSTASTTTTAASSTSANTAGTTAPGTSLAVGTEATVPYSTSDEPSSAAKFKLGVKVTAIEKGSLSDFNGIKLDAAEKASTPSYVKVEITNAGEGDAGKESPSIQIQGIDHTGEAQSSVTFLGEFPRCEEKEPPKPFTHGKSYSTCLTYMVPGGIAKAAYTGTQDYSESPLTWK
jgi:hypothetical protein